jgi:hypothetical protein
MGIIINGNMNVGSSGTLISSPYVEPLYTGSICVSGGGVDGTYAFTRFSNYYGGIRPNYTSISGLVNLTPGGKSGAGYLFRNALGDQEDIYYSTTFPTPEYPYLENPNSWAYYADDLPTGFPITITSGSC